MALQVGEVLRSPFMKFVNYICSYTAFLVLLFFTTALTSTDTFDLFAGTEGVVHSLIMFYVLGTSTLRLQYVHILIVFYVLGTSTLSLTVSACSITC